MGTVMSARPTRPPPRTPCLRPRLGWSCASMRCTRWKDSARTLPSVRCTFFDQSCNLLRPRGVDRMAGAWDFYFVAVGSCGIPPFQVRVDGSVCCGYQHPAWFAPPRSRGNDCFEIVSFVQDLRSRHESSLLSRQVGCEVLMKLRGVEVSETVCRLLYRTRLAEVTGEALSVVSLILSSIWHVGRDVHQTGDRWIRPGFGNYRSPVAVSHKNAWSILLSEHALRSGDVFLEGGLRLLNDADVVAIFDKNVVNAFPARTICPSTVNQNNIPNPMLFVRRRRVLRGKRTAGQ